MEKKLYNQKLLRSGYTTGACAAAAAKAAATMLLAQCAVVQSTIITPNNTALTLDIIDAAFNPTHASCAVQKDSGDDPDITNGVLVYVLAKRIPEGIYIDGGEGVGRVTKPGLNQPVGAAAINAVPREMIRGAALEACKAAGYQGGISITVYIPGGEALAARTFNPQLGITGGLSILGTTGIVEPMSEQAMIDTIRTELNVLHAAGKKHLLLTPGNYGETFARDVLRLPMDAHVKCSNFIGDAISAAVETGFTRLLLVGHIGKLVKLGIGLMQTHSAHGDGRMETLLACALAAGAQTPLLQEIAACVTTDAALLLLKEARLLEGTMEQLRERMEYYLARKLPLDVEIGFIAFSNAPGLGGILVKSGNADALLTDWEA